MAKISELINNEILGNESYIAKLIRERWAVGEKPDGSAIGVYRNKAYAAEKYAKNPRAGLGFVDLTLTGSLGKNLKVSPYGSDYEIYSKDQKYGQIAKKYGDENFGIKPVEETELLESVEADVLSEVLRNTYK